MSDIVDLTEHFVKYYNHEMHKNIEGVSDEVLKIFKEYHWPGNVREFKNVIEGAFNFSTSNVIEKKDLPDFLGSTPHTESHSSYENHDLNEALELFEKDFILNKASDGVKSLSELADKLGISRQALSYKIKKYALKKGIQKYIS